MTLLLPVGTDDQAVRRRVADAGVDLDALSHYRRLSRGAPGLVIGYAGCTDAELDWGLARVRDVLDAAGQ